MSERHLFVAAGILGGLAGILTLAGYPWIIFGLLLVGAGAATAIIATLMSRSSGDSVQSPVDSAPDT